MSSVNNALGSGDSSARSKGSGMMTSFKSGLQSGVSGATSVGRSAAQQVQSGLGSNYWGGYSAGSNLMWGFNNGMWSVAGTVYSTAQSIANNCVRTINSALRINSPSRVTRETGGYFSLGLALGIEDKAKSAYSEVSDLSSGIIDALDVAGEAASLGRAIGDGFGSGLSGSLNSGSLLAMAEYSKAVNAEASSIRWSAAPSTRISHGGSFESADDTEMARTIASAVAQGVVSVQMANGTAGTSDTTIVLRVGNEELARAVAKGNDSLARRGVVKLS